MIVIDIYYSGNDDMSSKGRHKRLNYYLVRPKKIKPETFRMIVCFPTELPLLQVVFYMVFYF